MPTLMVLARHPLLRFGPDGSKSDDQLEDDIDLLCFSEAQAE